MHRLLQQLCFVITLVATLVGGETSAQNEFEGWNLEPSVGQAHLVMVARVVRISRVTVVEGAKTDVSLREFRFQPVRLLKGIFHRDELSMTASDLGIAEDAAASAPPLKEGEFRLLILVQQSGFGSLGPGGIPILGCVTAAPGVTTFAERVPLVTGPDDPLVAVVDTLVQVADARSRRQRAALLIDRLTETEGLATVPLLNSLRLRADWAARDDRAYPSLARLARDSLMAVHGAALLVLRDMLASGAVPDDPTALDGVAVALREMLESDEDSTSMRLSALAALGNLLAMKSDYPWSRELLITQLTGAATHAERAAVATALAQVEHPDSVAAVLGALAGLPLDEPAERETVYARAAVKLDAARAEQVLLDRVQQSIAARQSIEAEVNQLGQLRSMESLPLLLEATRELNLSRTDRQQIAAALGRLGDDRAVPMLIEWLRGNDYYSKESALAALERIDSPMAAHEARPLLRTEPSLPYKLRIARLVARHGFADGYALATEHLAEEAHTALATLVLVALDDPRTVEDLSAILSARPDRHWHAAALTGLAAVGDAAARRQLLEILADDRHPLAADAAQAAGLAADSELLLPLAVLVQSRNQTIAMSSLTALQRFMSNVRTSPHGLRAVERNGQDAPAPEVELPAEPRAAIAEVVASLALDAYVADKVRSAALKVAGLLGGERYDELLFDLADQAELEGNSLLQVVQAQQRRSQRAINAR